MTRAAILEEHLKDVAQRPQRKNEDTITKFDRNIFWYDRDTKGRQTESSAPVTYEDHRRAIETAVNMMRKDTQHDIAMCLLTHRYFTNYRNLAFAGSGNFVKDYTFLVMKIGMVFNYKTSQVNPVNISSRLNEYTEPTLVQVNHITGTVTEVTPPGSKLTLNEWAVNYNKNSPESTTYQVAGLQLGA